MKVRVKKKTKGKQCKEEKKRKQVKKEVCQQQKEKLEKLWLAVLKKESNIIENIEISVVEKKRRQEIIKIFSEDETELWLLKKLKKSR